MDMDCNNRDSKNINDAKVMLIFLRTEEEYYIKTLTNMKQELMRLEIEDLSLKAAIRQEQVQIDKEDSNTKEMSFPTSSYCSSECSLKQELDQKISLEDSEIENSQDSVQGLSLELSNIRSVSPETDTVESNITDERYLEPLILNPNSFDDNALMEFDD